MCHIAKHIVYQTGSREEPETTPFILQEKFDIIFYEIKYGKQLKRMKENTKIYKVASTGSGCSPDCWGKKVNKEGTEKKVLQGWFRLLRGGCPVVFTTAVITVLGGVCLPWNLRAIVLVATLADGFLLLNFQDFYGCWVPARPFFLP